MYSESLALGAEMYPMTPGLLTSMAIRYDHGYGIGHMTFFQHFTNNKTHSVQTSQIRTLAIMFASYHMFKNGCADRVEAVVGKEDARRLWEEITGAGFYQPSAEEWYCNISKPEALEVAKGFCEEYTK